MKRFFVVLMALLFAGSAFAQEVKTEEKKGPEFSYGLKGAIFGVTGVNDDLAYDYSHIRVRPSLNVTNGNIKGVLTFEIDQDFGKGDAVKNADPGTDNLAVEVKHAYLDAKDVIIPGLTLMGGLNEYSFPLVVKNDFALVRAGFDFGMGKVFVSYIAVEEQDVIENTAADAEDADDVDVYAVDLPLKFDAISVRPGLLYIVGGDQSTYAETGLTNVALNVSGDMGMVVFNVSGAYLTGDTNATNTAAAYAVDVNVDVKPVEGIKVGAFFTMGSGDDDAADDEEKNYFGIMNTFLGDNSNNPFAANGKTNSGAPDGRLFLFENASAASNGGVNYFDAMDNQNGYMSYGLYVEAKMDKLALFAQFGMANLVEDNAAGDTAIGSEIDLRASYTIGSKTDLFVEAAYLVSGDILEENAYQGILGVTTSL
ncbi:MAG: hypothetical protein GXY14_08810 [Spirochaetes bacterium]|nr:hypothetical protein [Spirochaetota bacterium]